MKTLAIERLVQETGSGDCGPVCTQMVLMYFGIDEDLVSLKEKLAYIPSGTSAYANGSLLIAQGLSVTAITANPLLFPRDTIPSEFSEAYIEERITERLAKAPNDQQVLDDLRAFLGHGGMLHVELPELHHIREAIGAGSPIIALIYGQALGKEEGGFHFVVVNGYNDDSVHVVNPRPGSQGASWTPVQDFFHALYASSTGDPDNATLLIVSKS